MPPEDDDADLDTQGEGQDGGTGKPQKSSKDDETVPLSRLTAALANAEAKWEAKLAEQAREIAALRAAPAKQPEPKAPTRAELLAAVEAGTITQVQADAEFERQIVERATKAAEQAARTVTASATVANTVQADLAAFQKLVPEAWSAGSAERTKVQAAFNRLIARGSPNDISTELTALESVFGDLEALRESKRARRGSSERHQETGGGKPADGDGASGDEPVKGLDARQRAFYEKAIKAGAYTGWAAVKTERDAHAKRLKARSA